MARLVIFDDRVRAVDLPGRTVVIGRSLRADIPLRDPVLSRKHCTIAPIPADAGGAGSAAAKGRAQDRVTAKVERFRFEDLRSANGSWVNGRRVQRAELEYDDVVEVGTTVLVLLDSESWNRGEGLARLRNPVKAQELVQRIQRQARRSVEKDVAGGAGLAPEAADEAFVEWARGQLRSSPFLLDLLADDLSRRVTAGIVTRVPELRAALGEALERVFVPESFQGGAAVFGESVRAAVREALAEAGLVDSPADGSGAVDETPREEGSSPDTQVAS